MSATYGYLWGNRGTATRCGSKASGITARLKTWKSEARVQLGTDDELRIDTQGKMKIYLNGRLVGELAEFLK